MTRAFGIVGAAFALVLALAPTSGDAQIIAGADFPCVSPQFINSGVPITFQQNPGSANFGGSITLNAGGQSFTFAQTGIYQIHLDGIVAGSGAAIQALLNGVVVTQFPLLCCTESPFSGDRLISANAGDVFALVPNRAIYFQPPSVDVGYCELVITQVQSAPPPAPPPPVSLQPGAGAGSIIQWSRHDLGVQSTSPPPFQPASPIVAPGIIQWSLGAGD